MKFKKKPVIIDAVKWNGSNWTEIKAFCPTALKSDAPLSIMIPTMEGVMTANCQDWIIRGVKGEFYPCKPDIFEATYEPA